MRRAFIPNQIALPGAAEVALAQYGLPLVDLYDFCLGKDLTLCDMVEKASGHHFTDYSTAIEPMSYCCDGTALLDRMFLWHQPCWPAVLTGYDLFVEWCDTAGRFFARTEPANRRGRLDHLEEHSAAGDEALLVARGTARFVEARYEALMRLFRTGVLEAYGHWNGGGEAARISPALWSTPSTRINFGMNEVHVFTGLDLNVSRNNYNILDMRRETTECRWSAVMVKRAAIAKIEAASISKVARPKGGISEKYPWDAVFDRMTCKLVDLGGYPDSIGKLVEIVRKCFDDERIDPPADRTIEQKVEVRFPQLYAKCRALPRR